MQVTRREFMKTSAVAAGVALTGMGFDLSPVKAHTAEFRKSLQEATRSTTICPYCAVGCSLVVHASGGKVINIEGDPDHPINEGTVCAKGASLFQMAFGNNENRLDRVLYRAPFATEWTEMSLAEAVPMIAQRIKETRDATFETTNGNGATVNRTLGIGSLGSAALDNEECWLYQKFLRALGLVYVEHQARNCHSSTVASLATSFGRGAMTNHWIDIRNSDVIIIMGSNAAECHPVSIRWVNSARANGAKLISVDPRFTRTSAVADLYAPIRAGTDIAFLGGMINYILENAYIHEEYVKEYTNAPFILNDDFDFDTVTGVFSGYDPAARSYDQSAWAFQTDDDGVILKDKTLEDPKCVYQFLKRHYARYDVDTVSSITGTPVEKLNEVYETYVQSSYQPGTAGTIMYAMGWTQHTVGAQYIRTMSLVQLLLGNIGVAGGGVNALRGESNVQGSTDHCLLFHILPGYLNSPVETQTTLSEYNETARPLTTAEPRSANWWQHTPKYMASFLKSLYGEAATAANDFRYDWLPKRDAGANYAWQPLFDAMYNGVIKGFFAWGQNPACSSANANKVREAMGKLDWMVTVNLYPTETAEFWRGPGMDPASIGTEVFQLPCRASVEKEGSITNSGRWAQWRYAADVDLPEDVKADAEIMNDIFTALQGLYETGGVFPDPILNLKWDYFGGSEVPSRLIAKEINGYFLEDFTEDDGTERTAGDLVPAFTKLRDDGKTSSGNWLYCASYTDHDFDTGNMMARRTAETDGIGLNPEWAWCWPLNRRIIYNRASVDLLGDPWDAEHPVIAWDGEGWIGDVPDGGWAPLNNPDGTENPDSRLPFIMRNSGAGGIFGPLKDGPVPEHYEPLESPLASNPLGHATRVNPAVYVPPAEEMNAVAEPGSSEYPIVCTTYRLTEHWQTGVMTRWVPWLNELQPEMFVEMSEELAAEKEIANGERVRVRSIRGEIQAVAIVTARFKPFTIMGDTVHHVGMPWCFGWVAPAMDSTRTTSANLCTPNVGDANTRIPENKCFMVDVVKEA